MRKIRLSLCSLFAMAIFAMVSCGESPKVNLPEYKLLSIEEPKVSGNGYISPTQNLVYKIEIDHPLQEDSLELLQNVFIEKGKSDFADVNKVIVRVYLKGASLEGLPYASLNLIGSKKEISITGSSKSSDFLVDKLKEYEIIGCWAVYGDGGYVICKKGDKYYAGFFDKGSQKVADLDAVKTKQVKGETAYYSPDDDNHEYMIIREDGLYIYDETGESGTAPVVWSKDPSWNNE